MPAPASLTFAATAYVAAHQGLLDRIDTGAGSAELVILDASDTELAAIRPSKCPIHGVWQGKGPCHESRIQQTFPRARADAQLPPLHRIGPGALPDLLWPRHHASAARPRRETHS